MKNIKCKALKSSKIKSNIAKNATKSGAKRKMAACFYAKITKYCKNYLKATILKYNSNIAIPKTIAKGAFLNDVVLVSPIGNTEYRVEKICRRSEELFTATVIKKHNQLFLKPDFLFDEFFKIKEEYVQNLTVYDKIVAKFFSRSENYKDNVCSVVKNCGSSKKAINCANAAITSKGVSCSFPEEVLEEIKGIHKIATANISDRIDLTNETILTIDGAYAKDLDDAISIEKFEDYYILAVHIADVSHYIGFNSAIEKEAFKRGTSIYYGDFVVPMLPQQLCNNLCSLSPNEPKLCLSIFITIDFSGNVLSSKLEKTVIKSKLKGVYEEINDVLAKKEYSIYYKKYEKFMPYIQTMLELLNILHQKKLSRNALEIETKESKVVFNSEGYVVDILEMPRNVAEQLIEEFMILANEEVAKIASNSGLPFLYRVHKPPTTEKVLYLKKILDVLHINNKEITPKMEPKVLDKILRAYKNKDLFYILNVIALRSMAKAEYSHKPLPHFGLALKRYTHFTSPIRRYSDLLVHRLLKAYIFDNLSPNKIKKTYKKHIKKSAKQTSKAEKIAISIERESLSFFKSEYMQTKVGATFIGTISSVIKTGMFITLPNTVEGFLDAKYIGKDYEFDGQLAFKSRLRSTVYKLGTKIKVKCISANTPLGRVDFSLA